MSAATIAMPGPAGPPVGRRLSIVTGFYRFAVVDGLIPHTPAKFLRSAQDQHRLGHPRTRPHGARGVHRLPIGRQPPPGNPRPRSGRDGDFGRLPAAIAGAGR